MRQVKTALIGFGYRGKQILRLLHDIPFFNIVGIADKSACDTCVDMPFYSGNEAYVSMLDELKPDLVFITTPWHMHVVQACTCAMHGCHVALEIKGGLARGEYAPLMRAAEKAGVRVFPLENTLFLREILAVKRMADEGVLGDIVYMRGGYRHDLRDILLDSNGQLGGRTGTESVWRSRFYTERNGDIYPTHALGPLCMILGIGHTDRLAWLTAFATKAVGLQRRMRQLGNTAAEPHVTMGDIVSTQIETCGGVLISLTHDTTLPRPRSLDFKIQGTGGIWNGVDRKIYIEGRSPHEQWEDDAPYIAMYESDYWQRWGTEAMLHDTHHHGMDYIMLRAIEADLCGDTAYPATLADLALWASVSVLSEESIAGHCRVMMD